MFATLEAPRLAAGSAIRAAESSSHATRTYRDGAPKARPQVSHVTTLDRTVLTERVGKLSSSKLDLVLSGLDVLLGR